jgi:RNA polymerase sigma-70 factor (ECF subfamily)
MDSGSAASASPSLLRLFHALEQGDAAAQAQLLLRYESWLKLLAHSHVNAKFQGKFSQSDIVQQTLLEACRDLDQFRGRTEGELLAWLRHILAHVLAHEIRRYRGTQQRDVDREVSLEETLTQSSRRLADMLAGSGISPSAGAEQHEQEVILADVLARLPQEYREVILLRNLEGLSHEAVAERMGRSVGAVRMLWIRALTRLRQEFLDQK